MDISLLSLTIATHEGAIKKANSEIEYCLDLLPILVRRWESIDYYFIFKIRYGIHLINMYDFMNCIDEMDQLERVIDNTFTLFPLVDGFSDLCKDIKSDIKGKVLGTRLQARINLMETDTTQFELAVIDSENAMKEFSRTSDLNRQYQYRSRIEYEAGYLQSGLKWLKKSITTEDSYDNLNKIFSIAISGNKIEAAFTIMHFVNIMLLALEANENQLYSSIYSAWKHNNVDEYIRNSYTDVHPYEIIYWKIGKLMYMTGNYTAGEEKIDIALNICNKSRNNQIFKAIGLGILADKAYLLSSTTSKKHSGSLQAISLLCSEYESYMSMDLPSPMKNHFDTWRKQIAHYKDKKNQLDYENLKYLSKQIYY